MARPPVPLVPWPVRYARRLRWRMLPVWWLADGRCACPEAEQCRSPGKHALVRGWPERAAANTRLIERWLTRWPLANWAVATGPESNVLVLDVDGPEGETALAALELRYAPFDELHVQQWTGSGNGRWQMLFSWPAGRSIGNSAGRLGPGLDTRGEGGYAHVPPSKTKRRYTWAVDRSPLQLPLEPAPEWLIELLDPTAAVAPDGGFDPYAYSKSGRSDNYGWRALESELALLSTANEKAGGLFDFSRSNMKSFIDLYKGSGPSGLATPAPNFKTSLAWANAGYGGWPTGVSSPSGDRNNCIPMCPLPYSGIAFDVNWYPHHAREACSP